MYSSKRRENELEMALILMAMSGVRRAAEFLRRHGWACESALYALCGGKSTDQRSREAGQ